MKYSERNQQEKKRQYNTRIVEYDEKQAHGYAENDLDVGFHSCVLN